MRILNIEFQQQRERKKTRQVMNVLNMNRSELKTKNSDSTKLITKNCLIISFEFKNREKFRFTKTKTCVMKIL